MKLACLTVLVVILAADLLAQSAVLQMKMDQVMTQREMQDTGVSTLTPTQRHALDEWLNRYTTKVLQAALNSQTKDSESAYGRSICSPAIESYIAGEING